MTPENEIPLEVLHFIEEKIDDIPQLEALLMMSRDEHREWRIADVAARIYVPEQRAAGMLDALRHRGLMTSGGPDTFRFNPATPEARALVSELARCYTSNLARITTFIHSKPSASIQEFARAFDLKKDR